MQSLAHWWKSRFSSPPCSRGRSNGAGARRAYLDTVILPVLQLDSAGTATNRTTIFRGKWNVVCTTSFMESESESVGRSLWQVLLIDPDPGFGQIVAGLLNRSDHIQAVLTQARTLDEGSHRLADGQSFHVILVELQLPDSQGMATFDMLRDLVFEVPVIVVADLQDEAIAARLLREGAQDYLLKAEVSARTLERALCRAVDRHQLQAALRRMSLVDELTGLYNRRGFLTLGEQQLHLARRTTKKLLCAYADLDGLKQINDTFGHQEGDRAIRDSADILRRTFRNSDVIARIAGDEFSVVAVESSATAIDAVKARLVEQLARYNEEPSDRPYALSLSLGVTSFDTAATTSMEKVIAATDQMMYEQKHSRHQEARGPHFLLRQPKL